MSPLKDAPQWADLIKRHEPLREFVARDLDELATIVYTSGTTGAPQGVLHSLPSLAAPCRTARAPRRAPAEEHRARAAMGTTGFVLVECECRPLIQKKNKK